MTGLVALAVGVFGYAVLATRLDRLWITAPMVFLAAGLVLGPEALGVLPGVPNETMLRLAELTLAVILFADAATVPLQDVEGDVRLPGRLLVIGLPLTIVAGTVIAHLLVPTVDWAVAALIAAILAPTDLALGLAVVMDPAIPTRIRRALNVESGLNDGIATPFVTLFLATVVSVDAPGHGDQLVAAIEAIGLAVLAAIVVGLGGGRLLQLAVRRGWTSPTAERLALIALAVLAYAGSVSIGGNGFVAAFLGGLVFGAATGGSLDDPLEFTEQIGMFASFFVWAIFGATIVGPAVLGEQLVPAVAYAVVSLTLIRMVPVAIALVGSRLRRDTIAFIGWFGPRGLASVVFALLATEELRAAGLPAEALMQVVAWTILLSVVLHGLSAHPLAGLYARRLVGLTGLPELAPVGPIRLRTRDLGRRTGARAAGSSPKMG